MNKNFELEINYEDLNLKIKNMEITCYGAIGLMDFDYHFDLEITSSNNKLFIKQEFSEDISVLFEFCEGKDVINGNDSCSFEFYNDDMGYQIFEFKTNDLKFYKRVLKDLDKLSEFKINLKAYFDYLIEQYIKNHPED